MSTKSMGSLALDLLVRMGAFEQGMDRASRITDKRFREMERRAYQFGQSIGVGIKAGAVLATAALTSVTMAVGKAIDSADSMRDLSIRTGVATEKLSEYAYAAKQAGTDIDTLSRGLKILSKNATEALDSGSGKGKLFAALGVSLKDAQGNLKQLDVLLPEIADKFKGLEDGTLKSALALELMGKSGTDLIEFLNQGSQGLDEAGVKVGEFGTRVGSEFAAQADQFNDSLGDLKEIANGFAMQIAAELLPRLIEMVEYFKGAAQEGKVLGTSISDIGNLFDLFSGQVKQANEVGDSFRMMLSGVSLTVDSLKGALSSLVDIDMRGFIKKMKDAQAFGSATLLAGFGVGVPTSPQTDGGNGRTSRGGRRGVRVDIGSGPSQAEIDAYTRKLQLALESGKGGGRGSKKSTSGESDAARRAEEAAKALREAAAAQQDWHNRVLDMSASLEGPAAEVLRDYDKSMAELNGQFQDGKVRLDDYAKAQELLAEIRDQDLKGIKDQVTPYQEVNAAIAEQIKLLGMSAQQQEIYNNLKAAGVQANSLYGQSIIQNTEDLQRAREASAFYMDVAEGLTDSFMDFVDGSKSAKEAFGDFADQLFKRAMQFVADKAINAMFSAFSSMGSGGMPTGAMGDVAIGAGSVGGAAAGGSWWQSLLGAFGGGRAAGGGVNAGMFYRVNENGPEMLSVSGKDYLMMGNQSGMVTPNRGRGAPGVVNHNNFTLRAPTSQLTQEQIAERIHYETNLAHMRNR